MLWICENSSWEKIKLNNCFLFKKYLRKPEIKWRGRLQEIVFLTWPFHMYGMLFYLQHFNVSIDIYFIVQILNLRYCHPITESSVFRILKIIKSWITNAYCVYKNTDYNHHIMVVIIRMLDEILFRNLMSLLLLGGDDLSIRFRYHIFVKILSHLYV